MRGSCYVIKNKVNNKYYVGQTNGLPKERFQQHKRLARSGKGYILHAAIRKHGEENFELILEVSEDKEKLNELERSLVIEYNSCQPNGYNILDYGSISNLEEGWWKGKTRSEETKKKISETKKLDPQVGEKNPFYGKTHSDETKKILSEKAKIQYENTPLGKFKKTPEEQSRVTKEMWEKMSPEQRSEISKNISEGRKGIPRTLEMNQTHSERMKGRIHSDETKIKMSQAHIGVAKSIETRMNMKIAQQNRVSQEIKDQIVKIDEMLNNNIPVKDIATQMNITESYVYKIKNRNNITPNEKKGTTDPVEALERINKIVELLKKGIPGADISRTVNCSKTYVSNVAKKYGLNSGQQRTQEFRNRISEAQRTDSSIEFKFKELVESGVRLSHATSQLGIDRITGYRIAKRLNIDLEALREKFKGTGRPIKSRTKRSD